MKRVVVHLDRCNGCMGCEVACVAVHKNSDVKMISKDILSSFNTKNMRSTRIWVEANPSTGNPVPISCRHCLEPPCVEVCSIGALQHLDNNGTVINHEERCVGCWMCIMVCPYGAIDKSDKVAIKCDLCHEREFPACVEACPNEAIEYVDVELIAQHEREKFTSMVNGSKLC